MLVVLKAQENQIQSGKREYKCNTFREVVIQWWNCHYDLAINSKHMQIQSEKFECNKIHWQHRFTIILDIVDLIWLDS